MKPKLYTAREAVRKFVKPGDTVAISGFSQSTLARELLYAISDEFTESGTPNQLTFISGAGLINGLDMLAKEGLTACNICGHYGPNEALREFVAENKCRSYNLPQGMVGHLMRAVGNGEKGILSKIGLGTYVDPRLEGGRMNQVTTEDIISVVEFQGEEYLYYKAPRPNVALIRGSIADERGNVSLDEEMWLSFATYAAKAAHACGGKVIVQVKSVVKAGSLPARRIAIPGILVDAVVVTQDRAKNHRFTPNTEFSRFLLGEYKMPLEDPPPMPLNERKLIGRRAAMELEPGDIVNIGIGTSEAVSAVCTEEGCTDLLELTVESGIIGGALAPNERFGVHVNYDCLVDEVTQFDFYHSGGLDATFLGNAQTNMNGDVNVSKFGPLPTGGGGFIDIVQNTRKIVFCGTFTASGLKMRVADGKLTILQEGKVKKFVRTLPQISFNAKYASEHQFKVLYITERAVFRLTPSGIELIEYAPGIDIEKDIFEQMEFRPLISDQLEPMDERLLRAEKIGLRAYILEKQ